MTTLTAPAYTRSVGRPKIKHKSTTFRLAEDVFVLLEAIGEKEQIDSTAAVEKSVRDYAKRNGIKPTFRTASGASMTNETGDYSPTDPLTTKEG